jgi:predicted Fe-Mo cluster-binding NifX family protein
MAEDKIEGFSYENMYPDRDRAGKKAKVYSYFGSAPYFAIYDTEKGDCETVYNSNLHHVHGTCNLVGILDNQHIDAMVCTGIGEHAV